MSAVACERRRTSGAGAEVDLAGEQLLAAIDSTCERSLGFPAQIEASLGVALELFAGQGDMLCLLPAREDSPALTKRKIHWQEILAFRLRSAAKRQEDLAATPFFLEQILIVSVEAQIRAWLGEVRSQALGSRLPHLVDYVLAYYPKEAAAPRPGRGRS
jgi:hypothetical protein